LLAPRPTPKLEDLPLSAIRNCFSVCSQLPFISGSRLLHPQPENAPCRGVKGTHITVYSLVIDTN